MATASNHNDKARVLVLAPPDAPELQVLKSMPPGATLVGVGKTLEDLEKSESLCRAYPRLSCFLRSIWQACDCAGCFLRV